jgi:hypothetical protein
VTATVAGKTVTLQLTSGSTVDGMWAGSTILPVGSWMVTFQANTSKGADPTATLGPISVSLGVTQPPSSPGQPATDTPEPGDTSTTAEPKPQHSAEQSSGGGAPAAGTGTGTGEPSGGAAAAASEAPGPATHRPARHPRPTGQHSSSSPNSGAAPVQPTATASTGAGQAVGRELVGMVLLFGIGGVAAVALLGAAWIIISARRDRAQPSVVALPTLDPRIPATPALPSAERRALRRAQLPPSDDPILAALGLHDERPPTDEGPSEQSRRARRFRRPPRT